MGVCGEGGSPQSWIQTLQRKSYVSRTSYFTCQSLYQSLPLSNRRNSESVSRSVLSDSL